MHSCIHAVWYMKSTRWTKQTHCVGLFDLKTTRRTESRREFVSNKVVPSEAPSHASEHHADHLVRSTCLYFAVRCSLDDVWHLRTGLLHLLVILFPRAWVRPASGCATSETYELAQCQYSTLEQTGSTACSSKMQYFLLSAQPLHIRVNRIMEVRGRA